MNKFAIAAVALMGVASPAYAAGGLNVEVQGGYDAPKTDGTIGASSGITYGATLAYEMPVDDSIFVGVEASVNNSTSDECVGTATAVDPQVCIDYGRDFGAGARLGFNVSKNTALYGVVGYSNLRVGASVNDGTTLSSGKTNVDGVQVGVGVRQWFGKRAYGKVEYRYSNYEAGVERHQGLVGVGYEF